MQQEIQKETTRYIRHALKSTARENSIGAGGGKENSGAISGSGSGSGSGAAAGTGAGASASANGNTGSGSSQNGKEAKERDREKDAQIPGRVAAFYAELEQLSSEKIELAQRLVLVLTKVNARLDHDLGRVMQLSGEGAPEQQQHVEVKGGYVVSVTPIMGGVGAAGATTITAGGVTGAAVTLNGVSVNGSNVNGLVLGTGMGGGAVGSGMGMGMQQPMQSGGSSGRSTSSNTNTLEKMMESLRQQATGSVGKDNMGGGGLVANGGVGASSSSNSIAAAGSGSHGSTSSAYKRTCLAIFNLAWKGRREAVSRAYSDLFDGIELNWVLSPFSFCDFILYSILIII